VRAVFDASVFVRAVVDRDLTADAWLRRSMAGEVSVAVPDLVYGEVANAVLQHVRHGTLPLSDADRIVDFVCSVPVEVHELRLLARAALGHGSTHGLSVYDALYAVLAEAQGDILVTADRRLAGAVSSAELLS
jgi:predicted nucleic acid-binding protein